MRWRWNLTKTEYENDIDCNALKDEKASNWGQVDALCNKYAIFEDVSRWIAMSETENEVEINGEMLDLIYKNGDIDEEQYHYLKKFMKDNKQGYFLLELF